MVVMRYLQGEILDLIIPGKGIFGSLVMKKRPWVVISNRDYHAKFNTILVSPLTTKDKARDSHVKVLKVENPDSGLKEDSWVDTSVAVTVSVSYLNVNNHMPSGRLHRNTMEQIVNQWQSMFTCKPETREYKLPPTNRK